MRPYSPASSCYDSQSPVSEASTACPEPDIIFTPLPDFIEEKYILVTGGLGYIGSHTSLELLKAGHNIIIVDNLSNSFRSVYDRILILADDYFESIGALGKCPQVKLHDIDYRDQWAMKLLLELFVLPSHSTEKVCSSISGVIHFAAFKAVEESIRDPLKYYRNNVNGLVDFLSLLDTFNIKTLIFSSSATVYGTLADKGLPIQEEDCVHEKLTYRECDGSETQKEQGCTGLTNPYGRTKFFGEAILADLAASDPSWNIIALRYFNPIGCDASGLLGEDPKGTPSNLLPAVVKVMTGQWKQLSIFGSDWDTPDGTAVRDFIHVTDLAKGHIAALSATQFPELDLRKGRCVKENFRTFNLGTGSGHSVMDIVNTMESAARRPIPRRIVGRRPGDVGSCVAVAKRAAIELDWKTERSLRDACRDICNYLAINEV